MHDIDSRIVEIKDRINEELKKENSDNSIILQLSHELARLNHKEVRFSVDAGIINRLGKELVGRHETAVSELVKNAYDADALEVKLTFENTWQIGGTLYIEDDGIGMTREQLINGFMRLSSSEKIHSPVSPRYNRIRAGKKGIGRFATQRLGTVLTIITQTLESVSALKIKIEWENFETDKDLLLIANEIVAIPKTKEEGTTLIIEGLREAWSDAMVKRAYRYTADLLQPFPLSKKRKEEEKRRIDPGFHSFYFRKNGESKYPIADDEIAFFKYALAEIEGYVKESGQGYWTLKSNLLNFHKETFLIGKDRDNEKSPFRFIRNVHFKCYYFIYESSLIPTQVSTFIKSVANESGGIRLYRNGFRVLPYGEKGNDWLGLDESTRRRSIVVPHQNISFFGFAEITDTSGDLFEETSSREGLIEHPAFVELTDFTFRCITSAVLKVAELRARKGTAGQKNWEKKERKKAEDNVDEAILELEKLVTDEKSEDQPDSNVQSSNAEKIKNAITKITSGRQQEKDEKKKLIEELNMLRILAGLGLVIGEFVHEIERFLPAFDADITFLKDAVKNMKHALQRTERLDTNLKSFTTYTSYFYEAISRNVLRELEPIELRDVIYSFQEVIREDTEHSNYIFHKPIFTDYNLWTVPMHKSEWASILFNFYTNSKKAIKRAGNPGELLICAGFEGNNVFLEFSDNGDGIPPQNHDKIFDAFFTTTSAVGNRASDQEAMTGIGLGLKIVRDIVESYGGEIFVASPKEGFTTTMRIEIPKNTEMQDEQG